MTWMTKLTERDQKELAFCQEYAKNYSHGSDGHNRMRLVATLAELLDARAPEILIGHHDLLVGIMLSHNLTEVDLDRRILFDRNARYRIRDLGLLDDGVHNRYQLVKE